MLVKSGNDILVKYKGEEVFAHFKVIDYGNVIEFQLGFPDAHYTTLLYNPDVITDASPWTEVGKGSSKLAQETGESLTSLVDYINGKEIDFAVIKKDIGIIEKNVRRNRDRM